MDARVAAKDSPKSRRTRARILDTAMALFAEVGCDAATNPRIADAAGLTRGAMLYHFADRASLLRAAADHVQAARAASLRREADAMPAGADPVDAAIDAYWRLLREPPFRAFAELERAAARDPEAADAIRPAQEAFDRAAGASPAASLFQAGAGAGPRLQASQDLARFALEGLARATLTYDGEARAERLLRVIKRAAHMLNRKGSVHDLWPE